MRSTEPDLANEEVPLIGMLAEFRIALRAEIEAARRNAASTAVPLMSGRLIARVGGSFQYAFKVESLLELPADSPADLVVPGRERLEATLVSFEGLSVVVSVGTDLGEFVPSARLQTDLTFLLRKLILRIEEKRDSPNPGADRLLGLRPPSGKPTPLTHTYKLNADQAEAAESSLGRDTTFIWGPPGTGKTHTIGVIGAELYAADRPCLIVSHTNIAVDQALLRIARLLSNRFRSGSVLRVGEPRDAELSAPESKELLLATHVERRQTELTARKNAIEAERNSLIEESKRRYREIEIAVWASEGGSDIDSVVTRVRELHEMETRLEPLGERICELRHARPEWADRGRVARVLLDKKQHAREAGEKRNQLLQEEQAILARLSEYTRWMKYSRARLASAQHVALLREQLGQFPTKLALEERLKEATDTSTRTAQRLKEIVADSARAVSLLERARAVGAIRRALSGLPNPEKQAVEVERLQQEARDSETAMGIAGAIAQETRPALAKVEDLTARIAAAGDVPTVDAAEVHVADCKRHLAQSQRRLEQIRSGANALAQQLNAFQSEADAFYGEYHATPEEIAENSRRNEEELGALEAERATLNEEWLHNRGTIENTLSRQVEELARWALCEALFGTADEMLEQLKAAHRRACEASAGSDLEQMRAAKRSVDQRIIQIQAEVEAINQRLAQIEEELISQATIIATTLTRAYLRDSIQGRSFDTVILDEASMAPIPALWVAAGLSRHSVVAVGDFEQLPPICQATDAPWLPKHQRELAKKWLGHDIFEVAGVVAALKRGQPSEHLARLKQQHRMHPEISAIPNHFSYGGVLVDDKSVRETGSDDTLLKWYQQDWGHDSPVLLVDTGSANAWVTSVSRGGSKSRLNFLSATVCVDLAEGILRADRDRAGRKILIISPYRPHARLVGLLLRQAGLTERDAEDEVVAGTAHSFQGSEADAVILDLVVDEPHWKTNLFVPQASEEMRRLLNVALTRARRRLIIVADFDWCSARGKQAFLGRDLIPFLLARYPRVEAIQIVPEGLAGRAARAHIGTLGGDVEPKEARLIVTQEYFYPLLFGDIGRATKRIVIYSPFLTPSKVETLRVHLRAACERGVSLFVVTKPHQERHKTEIRSSIEAEGLLQDVGVKLIHKGGMHEKLVFLDGCILWSGSLNPLSHSRTQEVMERRVSSEVVADYEKTLRLTELLAPSQHEPQLCPIHGAEIIASEGGDGDPFYWRCVVDGCYSRGIDDPPLQDGLIVLACGKPPEFGWWGDTPVWICSCGRRHRQRVHPNHLRLPRMKALIGKKDLRQVEKLFRQRKQGKGSRSEPDQQQFFAFGGDLGTSPEGGTGSING
jgi:hypothetical protein